MFELNGISENFEQNSSNQNDSHLYGVELINDLKENDQRRNYSRKKSITDNNRRSVDFSRRSTPFSQVPNLVLESRNGGETPFDDHPDSPLDPQLDRATPRKIKKRIKKIKQTQRIEEQEITHRVMKAFLN